VGAINGGVRSNIIPDSVEMIGTLRTFDAQTRRQIHERVERTATQIAASAGATVDVNINLGYPVTFNDPALTRQMAPTLQRVAGERFVESSLITGAEDFGADDPALVHPNHSPYFYADERALPVGVTAMTALALDFLRNGAL
jgi:amidohydrolase